MNRKDFTVLTYLDRPYTLLGKPLGDVAAFLGPLYMGLLSRNVLIFAGIGIVAYMLKRKLRREFPENYLFGVCYWNMPPFSKLIPSHQHFFLR